MCRGCSLTLVPGEDAVRVAEEARPVRGAVAALRVLARVREESDGPGVRLRRRNRHQAHEHQPLHNACNMPRKEDDSQIVSSMITLLKSAAIQEEATTTAAVFTTYEARATSSRCFIGTARHGE